MEKLVLAYSGGLDTSYCAKYLSQEEGFEVHAVSVNTGGFSEAEIKEIEEKALALGATSYTSIDAVTTFYEKVVKYLIFGNVLRNNTYPLSVSAERIVQAIEIVTHAKKIGAKYIAHGSTGAGNDQVRFDMIFQILAPEIKIITPIRDKKIGTRGRNQLPTTKWYRLLLGKGQVLREPWPVGNIRWGRRNPDLPFIPAGKCLSEPTGKGTAKRIKTDL